MIKTAPEIQHPSSTATHGRGLGMVAALADSVTVQGDESGRTITAKLGTTGHQRNHPCG
ncbi:hypothetical protein GCM10027073_29730 [Streptomyces chlorus]|uniref:Uncharacterized protein n=1 Tax=Streptomyces chlorus TaxID=887452 RepID=A0ABW1E938_9ACTN